MPVEVFNLRKVIDRNDVVLFDALLQDMVIAQVAFPIERADITSPDQIKPYWDSVKHETRQALLAFFVKPPEPVDSGAEGGFAVAIPIPQKVFQNSDYDLIEDVLPEIAEGLMHGLAVHLKVTKEQRMQYGLPGGLFESEPTYTEGP